MWWETIDSVLVQTKLGQLQFIGLFVDHIKFVKKARVKGILYIASLSGVDRPSTWIRSVDQWVMRQVRGAVQHVAGARLGAH